MKKFSIFLVFVLAFSFCSCHGTGKLVGFDVPLELNENEQIELTFWAKNDTNITQTQIYQKAIDDFSAMYPNIKINIRLYTDYSNIYNDVITNISTGTTPNVCITYPDHIATYLTGENVVVPLEELMENEKYGFGGSEVKFDSVKKSEIILKYLNEGKINGTQYALPFMRSTEACYINKNYVEALGYTIPETLTWDFVFEVSEAAMAKDEKGNFKVNGQKVMIPFIYKSTDNMMIQMLAQKNAGYSTDKGEILIFNDETKNILLEVSEHAKSRAFSTFKISSYPANFLNAGQCIFAVDSTAGATWMGSDAPLIDIAEDQLVEFETVVKAIPQFDTENPKMISQGPSVCIFNKENSREVLASWLFAQYLLTNEVQIAYSQTEGYVPVTSKAQNSETYKEYLSRRGEDNDLYYTVKLDATKLLIDNVDNTFVTPVFNGSASLRSASGQLIENVTKSVRRNQNVDEAYIDNLYKEMNSLYRLDNLNPTNAKEGKKALGELPTASAMLIVAIVSIWVVLAIYTIYSKIKAKKQSSFEKK